MSYAPTLSIVTINRNHAAGLQKTIDSLAAQTCQDFEWVFIDGASDDTSLVCAQAYLRAHDVCLSEPDRGIYHAMNKGIALAKNDFVLFLNSGDTFVDSTALEMVRTTLAQRWQDGIDVLLCGFEVRKKVRMPKPIWLRWWSLPTSHQAMIYARALLQRYPYDESYRFASDFEQFLRICKKPIATYSLAFLLVHNEPYGSDQNLPKVLREYQKALVLNDYPFWLSKLVYHLKRFRLAFALRDHHSDR